MTEISITSGFLNANEVESLDDKRAVITSEAVLKESRWGKRWQVEVELSNAERRTWTLNTTSIRNLVSAFGKETKDWIGQVIEFSVEGMLIRGIRQKVLIAHPYFDQEEMSAKAAEIVSGEENEKIKKAKEIFKK